MQTFTNQHRRWRLADRHRLTAGTRTNDVVAITNDLIGLHSSDPATVFLSAFARMKSPDVQAVERALYEDRSLVRHHAMRRTMWVMAPEVAQLAHGAATAKVARAERKRTIAALADTTDIADSQAWLDDATAEIVELIRRRGELATREIGKAFPHLVIPVLFGVRTKHPAPINAHTKILQGAGFDGTLVRGRPAGNWTSAEYKWNATDDWLGAPLAGHAEEPAAGELLGRWLRRFGPASETDIRWWFGWTAALTRKALVTATAQTVKVENGATGYIAADDDELPADPGPWVRLLPGLDPTAMGWKQRDWYIEPDLVPRLFDRFGNAGPTIWVDGQIVGGWVQRSNGDIAIELHTDLDAHHNKLLEQAVEELDDVLGDVVVRPRFPAPAQKHLFEHKN